MDDIERQVTVDADLDDVWALLTRSEELAGWLGAEVQLDPRPGGSGEVVDRDGTRRRLVVDEVEDRARISWHWWIEDDDLDAAPSRVEITLLPVDDGTRVHVLERPLVPSARARAGASGAWTARLLHLELSALGLAFAVLG